MSSFPETWLAFGLEVFASTCDHPAIVFTVYVLQNLQGRLYIGQTSDIIARLQQHTNGESRWTKGYGPWHLVHTEEFATRAEAMAREKQLKSGRANQELRRFIQDNSALS